MAKLTIDNVNVEVEDGITILEACKRVHIKIPTLCYLKGINEIGACRVCVVEVEGMENLVASCIQRVRDGMVIHTNSDRVRASRKNTLELLLSDHNVDCLSCDRSLNCELQSLARDYDCKAQRFDGEKAEAFCDYTSECIVRDNTKCIKCGRCISVCKKLQTVDALEMIGTGFNKHVGCKGGVSLKDSLCVNCGQCVINCPTGALSEKSQIEEVTKQLSKKNKRMVVAMAPSVRVALGESLGSQIGENVEGKMITALRRLGFDDVFDVDFGADLTIMEEANELIEKIKSKRKGPLFTSCCPAWIKFVEHNYPEFIGNLSTCKSPQEILSGVIKTYYANSIGVDPNSIYFVSIMPCTAKKFERLRDSNGRPNTDAVLTTRELAEMIKSAGLDFMNLENGKFDIPLGMSSGSGLIFGASGGIMESALRTVSDTLLGKEKQEVDYLLVRGMSGIKEAEFDIAGNHLKVAVVSGLANIRTVLEQLKSGEKDYDFIEVMACPGGCANGGGMPIHDSHVINNQDVARLRAKNLYVSDAKNKIRKSYENPLVQKVYKEFFGKPGSPKAREILHTHYVDRSFKNNEEKEDK